MRPEDATCQPTGAPSLGTTVFMNRFPVVDKLTRTRAHRLHFLTPDGRQILDGALLSRILETVGPDEMGAGKPLLLKVRAETARLLYVPTAWRRHLVPQIAVREADNVTLAEVMEGIRGQGVPLCLELYSWGDLKRVPRAPAYILVDRSEAEAPPAILDAATDSTLLIVSGIERLQDFEAAKARALDLFEGGFYAEPQRLPKNSLTASRALLLDLSRATGRSTDIAEVEAIFRKDPDLAFGLLTLARSAYFRIPESVTSIRQVIALLGYENLHKWAGALLFAADKRDPATSPLFEMALMRARTMERACWKTGRGRLADAAFVAGLFSLVHVALGLPLEEVLEKTNLADDIRRAITERSGVLGFLLTSVENAEQGIFNGAMTAHGEMPVTGVDIMAARTEAFLAYQAALAPTSPIAMSTAVRDGRPTPVAPVAAAVPARNPSLWSRLCNWVGGLLGQSSVLKNEYDV